jgi:lipoprotein-releasing system permease protein
MRLYSARNLEAVQKVFSVTENPPIREYYAEKWKAVTAILPSAWQDRSGSPTLTVAAFNAGYQPVLEMYNENIREPEKELLEKIWSTLDTGKNDISGNFVTFDAAAKTTINEAVAALEASDAEKMDAQILKSLKSLVLPKKVEVIGVYKASQMAVTPDIFMPLPVAQHLAGLEDNVQGISLRLTDAYIAEDAAREIRQSLGPDWSVISWGQEHQTFFNLINQQRAMMYFALSFIMLVSAFSMMAVMFTVTIQKRREIGVMKALGAAPGQIIRVFLYQGMILGVLGAILGVLGGRLVIRFRGEIQAVLRGMGFDPFSSQFTGFGVLPAHNNPQEQVMFAVMAFVLCSLAALIPAFFAARSDAAKSLRNL